MPLLAILVVTLATLGGTPSPDGPVPDASRQLVLVVTPSWDATSGTLRRFERASPSDPWLEVAGSIPVVVGRNGLAWGRGLHGETVPTAQDGPFKREGDGRATAGVFRLTDAFGYAERVTTGLPYIASDAAVECVDDSDSAQYNRVLRRDSVTVDWSSHEEMRRRDGLYRLGVIVDHNAGRVPMGGSCIFLHVWRGVGTSTAGCTAMPGEAMDAVAAWLDAAHEPVLVQLPQAAYDRLQTVWALP